MTHWHNPDVCHDPAAPAHRWPTPLSASSRSTHAASCSTSTGWIQPGRDQRGAGLWFQSRRTTDTASAQYTNRFFIELVNTLTASYSPTFDYTNNIVQSRRTINQINQNNYYGYGPIPGSATPATPTGGNIPNSTTPPYQASTLDLGGFGYTWGNPYSGGCWDLVFTADNAAGPARPLPWRAGQHHRRLGRVPTTFTR